MQRKGFEGWYFKHQVGRTMIALIPGRAENGAFVQLLSAAGSRQFPIASFAASQDAIRADRCLFSPQGCLIDLPGVRGEISYGELQPLRGDIMGPFRFLPMECRHGVISMNHSLRGNLTVEKERIHFDGGTGYIEKDSGSSFPRSYLWLQCNSFPEPCSVMISLADIPLYGAHFRGCICALIFRGREYRLATYRGVRVLAAGAKHIALAQGKLRLDAEIDSSTAAHPLAAPIKGQMIASVRENALARIRLRLWKEKTLMLDVCSPFASYEFVPRLPEPKKLS